MDKSSEYGRIYSEIVKGFSREKVDNKFIYFKHPTIAEHFTNYSNYELLIEEGLDKGLLHEIEKVESAIEGGWWTKEKESQIIFLKKIIENLNKTREKLLYPSQKEDISKQIKKNESILLSYLKERKDIVGYTVEDFVSNRITEQLLVFFAYKDIDFQNKLFENIDDYYNSSENFIEKIREIFINYSIIFNENNIKKIAACGFFQNLVYLNEDAYSFWGKATTQCSKYQIDVLLYGKMFKTIIKNSTSEKQSIPDEILYNPDRFVEWVENKDNQNTVDSSSSNRKQNKNTVTSYVGATPEDLKKLGVKVEKIKGKSLLQLAEEQGGTLEKFDYLNARENP